MLDKGRISSVQLLFLLLIVQDATAFLVVPSLAAQAAGPDAWLSNIFFVSLFGLIVGFIGVSLAKRFPDETLTEYIPKIVGKPVGKILIFVYCFAFIHLASVVLAEESDFMHVNFFRETPLLSLDLLLIIAVAYGVYLGIEVIARQNEIAFPVFFLAIISLLIMVSPNIEMLNLLPIMENGLWPVLEGSILPATWRGEIFFILMLFPYLDQKEEANKIIIYSIIITTILSTLVIITCIGVLTAEVVKTEIYPVFRLARYISLARLLERLEILVVVIWVAGAVIKLAVFLHSGCIASANLLGIKNWRIMIIPFVLTMIIVSHFFYDTYPKLIGFLTGIWPVYALTIELLIPGLVLIIAVLRKKGANNIAQIK